MSSNPCINNKEVTSYYLPFFITALLILDQFRQCSIKSHSSKFSFSFSFNPSPATMKVIAIFIDKRLTFKKYGCIL
ncbi:hypothetical protein, partial [Limosilactobacillus oris]|uniref:hypothetical protein n=1 Tax=Limosilactobacillus oris TaxID=1632 RepID=UPI0026DCEC2E